MKAIAASRGSRKYIYRFWGKRLAIGLLDAIGTVLVRIMTKGRGRQLVQDILENPATILIVRLDHMGDVLFSRPALATMRARYPKAKITALVSSVGAALLTNEPGIDEIMIWDAPWFARSRSLQHKKSFWSMVKLLQAKRIDLSFDLRGDLRHHVMLFLAGVRVRVGYGITGGGFLLHKLLSLQVGRHEVERDLAVIPGSSQVVLPESYTPLVLSEQERQAGRAWWLSNNKHIVLHVSAGDTQKVWPTSAFAQVCDTLTAQGYELVLVGTASETKHIQSVLEQCSRPVRNLAGKTKIRELAALITAADLFIGNDSGPGHLAITQGIPTILLWSETNTPEEWGPWGSQVRAKVIREPWRVVAVEEVLVQAQVYLNG